MLSRVWELSAHGGTELLMLLAIADFADDDGNAYPSVPTLAAKCRMKLRNANYILAALQASGELEVRKNEGPHGTNRYRVVLSDPLQRIAPPLHSTAPLQPAAPLQRSARTPAMQCTKPLQRIADEPSLNRQEPVVVRAARSATTGASRDRGTRLPDDWTLPAEWRNWAAQQRPDLDPGVTADAFADYWHAQPGVKGRKVDWLATWRNWVRNQRGTPGTAAAASPARTSNPDTAYDYADEVAR